MTQQQGDVVLFQSVDGGEVQYASGLITMDGGIQTAAYVSMFGGNYEDDGQGENNLGYWANLLETEPSKKYRSETQHLLDSIPATSGNLRRIEDAARRDLEWFITDGVASSVEVAASIPGINQLLVEGSIQAAGGSVDFKFLENWKASA